MKPRTSECDRTNHRPSFNEDHFLPSRERIFSRTASMMNSDRLRYAYSGWSRKISSIFSRSLSGIFTVVYEVAIYYIYVTPQLIIGSNVVVIHNNNLIGGIY